MPRRPAKLSNCYVPLPLPSSQDDITTADIANSASKTNKEDIAFRHDGRSAGHELRRLCLETSVITRALGSSLVELGHTKVLAEVHIAPAQIGGSNNKKRNSNSNEATNDSQRDHLANRNRFGSCIGLGMRGRVVASLCLRA